jgi:23S rRNA (pseudouridine1915-N3)-methyltransferase
VKISVFLPSKSSDSLTAEGIEYLDRMRSPFSAQAVFLSPKSQISEDHKKKRMELEGIELLEKSKATFRIALTENGKLYSSAEFAKYLGQLMHRAPKVSFIIGGAFGLSEEVLNSCEKISLSPMTMPHRMAFLVLCEQLYRAQEIMKGTAYHK